MTPGRIPLRVGVFLMPVGSPDLENYFFWNRMTYESVIFYKRESEDTVFRLILGYLKIKKKIKILYSVCGESDI